MEFIANANKAKSDFLSNMSHDMATPIMQLWESLITKKDIGDMKKLLNDLETIEISAKHLLNLINDVLDMSKIESKNITYTFEKISIRTEIDYIASVVSNFRRKGNIFCFKQSES